MFTSRWPIASHHDWAGALFPRAIPLVRRKPSIIGRMLTARHNTDITRMLRRDDEDVPASRVTAEARHWLEYGVFAFVVVTAMATATAAWYTPKEWQSSVDNGRRQLRAYVFPEQANLVWQGIGKPAVAEIVIKNSGQTPAYRLSAATTVLVSDRPLQTDLRVPEMPSTRTVVPPAGSYALSVAADKPLTGDQLKAIEKGSQAIYAIGEVAYEDAFGECRTSRYRFFYSGASVDNGSRTGLAYLDEGNTEVSCSNVR